MTSDSPDRPVAGDSDPSVVVRSGGKRPRPASPARTDWLLLSGPASLVGLVLIAFPLGETLLAAIPANFSSPSWRFGAVGMLSRAIMTPLLGDLVLTSLALANDHRLRLRLLAIANLLVGASLILLLGLFGLDAVQMRSIAEPGILRSFEATAGMAGVKILVGAVAAFWIGGIAWTSSRR